MKPGPRRLKWRAGWSLAEFVSDHVTVKSSLPTVREYVIGLPRASNKTVRQYVNALFTITTTMWLERH